MIDIKKSSQYRKDAFVKEYQLCSHYNSKHMVRAK